jgi:hypothetical protein
MALIPLPNATTVSGQCPTYPDMAITITPADANTFAGPIIVQAGTAGTITFIPWTNGAGGATVATSLPAGGTLGVRVCAVFATGTTAGSLIGIY